MGGIVLVAGVMVGLGLRLRLGKTASGVSAKDASEKVETLKGKVEALSTTAIENAKSATTSERAVSDAKSQGDEVQSVLQDIGGIVSALPENLRFAGLLVLVGTVLMSVATTQFGGHALF